MVDLPTRAENVNSEHLLHLILSEEGSYFPIFFGTILQSAFLIKLCMFYLEYSDFFRLHEILKANSVP